MLLGLAFKHFYIILAISKPCQFPELTFFMAVSSSLSTFLPFLLSRFRFNDNVINLQFRFQLLKMQMIELANELFDLISLPTKVEVRVPPTKIKEI